MIKDTFSVSYSTHIEIRDVESNELLLETTNAVHPQNMARAISRNFAREPNGFIKRIAFGNGGTFTDTAGNTVYNPTNTEGWDARLYNETYSEIVDELDPNFGDDPGSAEAGNIRQGGGAVPSDDPVGGGVISSEVGDKSNIVIRCYLNRNEPNGQVATTNELGPTIEDNERCFAFDEIGLYTPGLSAVATNGYSNIDVNNKISTDIAGLLPSTSYILSISVDDDLAPLACTILTPVGGTGPSNAITYGDLCEGINTGAWITSGARIDDRVFLSITDRSGGTYPSIINAQTFGLLNFQSKLAGSTSAVSLVYNAASNALFSVLANALPNRVNVGASNGTDAGVQNDATNPLNERERLLTHFVFPPIVKTGNRALLIVYTLTVSVAPTTDSRIVSNQVSV